MLRSMEKRRDVDARFYKPVCLLAVIDGISDGSIAPSDIDLDKVCTRFAAYVAALFPDRADMGWRPFWHLSRDGAWVFYKDGVIVGPDDFRSQRKPNSRRELTAKSDHIAVSPDARKHWRSAADRAELRDAVVAMMERDDSACVALAAQLSGREAPVANLEEGAGEPIGPETVIQRIGQRQGFQSSLAARRAIEIRAMTLATELLVSQGWQVEDVSTVQSYDLQIRRGADVGYVEVKGTTGAGGEVQITAAEVEFARAHQSNMRLIIVSGIKLILDESGDATATGGNIRSIERWAPKRVDLKPISFFYVVPGVPVG